MANEASITAVLTFAKNGMEPFSRAVVGKLASVAGNLGIYNPGLSVLTSETVIGLGALSAPLGLAWFHNLDAVNYLEIKTAASGTVILKLLAGEACVVRLGSGLSAPVAIANTAACLLEYLILSP